MDIINIIKDNWALVLGVVIGLTLVIKFKGGNNVNVKGNGNTTAGRDVKTENKNGKRN